jgi:hypothetical protein
MDTSGAQLHTEASLAFLVVAAAGAATALGLAALVAGAGIEMAVFAAAGTFGFGLAADGRAETVRRRVFR